MGDSTSLSPGIAARTSDEGMKAIGRHARTIRLGRSLWQSPPLHATVTAGMRERFFNDGSFPPRHELRVAVQQAKKADEPRPAPFEGKTRPFAHLSITNYEKRMHDWLEALHQEDETPTTEQFSMLRRVSQRVLVEYHLEKEGSMQGRAHPDRRHLEQPLLAFCHGCPGTGKSRLIKWIRRMFMEALGWQHENEFLCVAFQNRVARQWEDAPSTREATLE